MDITNPHVVRTALLNTYADPDEIHPLERFEQYGRVMACREKTGAGRVKISDWFDIPSGRVTHWIYNDGKPTGYETDQRARSIGLYDFDWRGEQFHGLNQLVAWVFSGGHIHDRYTPQFNVGSSDREACAAALDRAGAPDYVLDDHASASGSTKGFRITDGQALFGRVLVALGAPQGRKRTQVYGLPCYLGAAPEEVRREFASIYVLNRGVCPDDKNHLTIREERPAAYLEALAGLFRSLTDATVTVGADYRITIGDAVLSDVDVPKKFE